MSSTGVLLNYTWKTNEQLKQNSKDVDELGFSDAIENIAKKELREDRNAREQCLHQLRNWIRKNEDIENVRMDDKFLLRFLRVKKFSIPMAQQTLLKYLNLRKTFPQMTFDLDFLGSTQNEILSNGYIFASPVRDCSGRRVILMDVGKFDPKKYSSADMAKAHFIVYETLLEDPENQVLGLLHVADFSGITAAHVTNWNPTEFGRIIKWGEQSVPLRHKGIHLVHLPSAIKWILDFVKSRVSPKIKDRFHVYVTLNDLYKEIDPSVLPLEMGGKIPMRDMIESWKRELAAKRDLLLALDKMNLLNDRGIVSRRDGNNNSNSYQSEIDTIAGSFRKLDFD